MTLRTLAAAQTLPLRGDVDGNVAEHARLIELAAAEGVQVLVFPEVSLTGYELDLAEELAFSEHDSRLTPLIGLAAVHDMTLVVGAPARVGARLHIGAFILGRDRSVGLYTKQHLGAFATSASPDGVVPPAEASVFQPGNRDPLVRFGDHTAAVAVCADTGQPSHAKAAADRAADTYLASMFVIPADLEKETATLQTYAEQHAMAVVFSNYGGPSGGLPAAGRSAIWSDTGEPVTQLEESGSGLAIAREGAMGWRGRVVMLGRD